MNYNGEDAGIVNDYNIWMNGNEDNFNELMKKWILYIYGFKIQSNHPVFLSLKEIVNYSKKYDKQIYFYITPIDYEYSKIYLDDVQEIVRNNVDFLKDELKEDNIFFSDYSTLLGSEYFMYEVMVDEHLNDKGRQILSTKIIEDLSKFN